MKNSIAKRNYSKVTTTSIGIITIVFGVYVLYSLLNILLEDIRFDFGLLRLFYSWDGEYYLIHMWVYPIIMILGGCLIISNKKSRFLEFIIIGFLVFFLDTFLFSLSILNFIMLMIIVFYYYEKYMKGRKQKKYIVKMMFVLFHLIFIFTSKYYGIFLYEVISHIFTS